jgi:oligopeptidase B
MNNRLRRPAVLLAAILCCASFVAGQAARPTAPVAKRIDHTQVWHGETVNDPYFWLREKANPEVAKYLEAENAYTEAMTAGLAPFRDALYKEMLARIKQTDLGVPTRDGKHYYYSRTVEGQQYPLYCRKPMAADGSYRADAPELVMLDQNEMAKGLKFLGIGAARVSDDGNLLAYSTDTTGFRQYTLHVRALVTRRAYADTAERVTSVEWANDNQTLFYVTEDKVTKRPNQLWRMKLGSPPMMVYEEKDELFDIGVGRTKDKRYLVLAVNSTDTWENRYLDAATPGAPFKTALAREKGHKYSIDHRDGLFYILTNKGAKNFRMVTTPVANPVPANWKEFIPHRPDVLIQGLELFKDFAVAVEQSEGLRRLRVFDFAKSAWRELTFPESIYTASPGGTPEYNSPTFRVSYQSMVTPPSIYDFTLATLERTLMKQQEVLGGYSPADYVTERQWAPARDGVRVPISLVYKKGVARDGTAPLWLYGYGSYGYGESPTFSSGRLSLLDRGVVFAVAHIRGGNEMGEAWHDDGMLMRKKNTFTDFIDCAEHLLAQRWAARDKVLIEGGSAGGLLMGAVTNMRPDLFKAVHAAVPFMDVMNTMMDATLPLTVGEYLEWGDPNQKGAFDYMRSYSPYDNLGRKAYPNILITTSFNDSQVMYWEPAKYVAKLRTLKADANELLLKTKMDPAGHGGASGRYDRLKDTAFEYAWMLKQARITK